MKQSYNTFQEEQNAVEEYVNDNPYPEYSEIYSKLPFKMRIEYGELNHMFCKKIYENITNDKVIEKCLKLLYRRGGERALTANYYTMLRYSPLQKHAITQSYMSATQSLFPY